MDCHLRDKIIHLPVPGRIRTKPTRIPVIKRTVVHRIGYFPVIPSDKFHSKTTDRTVLLKLHTIDIAPLSPAVYIFIIAFDVLDSHSHVRC